MSSPCRNVVLSHVQFLLWASVTRSARTYVPPTLSVQHDSLPQRVAPQAPGCYRCPSPQEARRATRVRFGFRSHEGGPVGRSTCRPSKTMFAGSTIGGKITSLWYPIQQLAVRGKSSEQHRRRPSFESVSSSLEDPDGPAAGSLPLMSSSHRSPSGDRTHQ